MQSRRLLRRLAPFAIACVLSFIGARAVFAHSIGLSRGDYRLQGSDLTAELIFARPELLVVVPELDSERDGVITPAEVAGARGALERIVVQGLAVTAPDGPCAGTLRDAALTEQDGLIVRAVYHCRADAAAVSVELKILAVLSQGHRHLVTATGNGVATTAIAYEGNAVFRVAASQASGGGPSGLLALASRGVATMLLGFDHPAFLLGLLLIGRSLRPLLLSVLAFTLAHSISLAMIAMHVFTPRQNFVGPALGLSVAYVCVENLFVREPRRRWLIALAFGVVHGFAFGTALLAVAPLPPPLALLAWNAGLEAGQAALLLPLLPLMLWLHRKAWFGERGVKLVSAVLLVAEVCWFSQRPI
jgi:HupE / UreJ protein